MVVRISKEDTDDMPAERDEKCLNCEYKWGLHHGWRCPTVDEEYLSHVEGRSKLPAHKRYLSSDMVAKEPDPCSKPDCGVCQVPLVKKDMEDIMGLPKMEPFDFDAYNSGKKIT